MYLTLESFEEHARPVLEGPLDRSLNPLSFLPGPVSIRRDVREALENCPSPTGRTGSRRSSRSSAPVCASW